MLVMWRADWGAAPPKKVTIKSIELCEEGGRKDGISVQEVWTNLKDRCIFTFNENDHWAYGYRVDIIPD